MENDIMPLIEKLSGEHVHLNAFFTVPIIVHGTEEIIDVGL
jgi:hypothetical protein